MKGIVLKFDKDKIFIHNAVSWVNKEGKYDPTGKYYILESWYQASDLKTGLKIYKGNCDDNSKVVKADAVKYLNEKLSTTGNFNTFAECINKGIELCGLTPEFDKSKEHLILKDKLIRK